MCFLSILLRVTLLSASVTRSATKPVSNEHQTSVVMLRETLETATFESHTADNMETLSTLKSVNVMTTEGTNLMDAARSIATDLLVVTEHNNITKATAKIFYEYESNEFCDSLKKDKPDIWNKVCADSLAEGYRIGIRIGGSDEVFDLLLDALQSCRPTYYLHNGRCRRRA